MMYDRSVGRSRKKTSVRFFISAFILMLVFMCFPVCAHAKPKLSPKKVSVMSGKTKRVKLKGAKGSVSWSSSNKNVADVSGKSTTAKITATGAGKARVTAKYKGKNYSLTVTVKGIKNPGVMKAGKSVTLKATKLGKKVKWNSRNAGIVRVDKNTGRAVAIKAGKVKVTAKGTKGKASVTITVKANNTHSVYMPVIPDPPIETSKPATYQAGSNSNPGTQTSQGTSTPSTPQGNTTPSTPQNNTSNNSTPATPANTVSGSGKYHYEITVLNDGSVPGYPSRIYNTDDLYEPDLRRCALVYVKTDAPYTRSGEYLYGNTLTQFPYTILVDGKYHSQQCYTVKIGNARYDTNGRPLGGDVFEVFCLTPGVHTLEIVEDPKKTWDSANGGYKLSYTKTGVSIKVRYYDHDAEKEQWIAETVAKYTSPGMTDRQKVDSLKAYFRSDKFHHYPVIDRNGVRDYNTFVPISYINYTPFFVSGNGDCIESNTYFIECLKKLGITCKLNAQGTHSYAVVYLDGKWENGDISKEYLIIKDSDVKYIN